MIDHKYHVVKLEENPNTQTEFEIKIEKNEKQPVIIKNSPRTNHRSVRAGEMNEMSRSKKKLWLLCPYSFLEFPYLLCLHAFVVEFYYNCGDDVET